MYVFRNLLTTLAFHLVTALRISHFKSAEEDFNIEQKKEEEILEKGKKADWKGLGFTPLLWQHLGQSGLCHQINQTQQEDGICLKNKFEPGLRLTPFNTRRAHCWLVEGCWSRWAWQAGEGAKRERICITNVKCAHHTQCEPGQGPSGSRLKRKTCRWDVCLTALRWLIRAVPGFCTFTLPWMGIVHRYAHYLLVSSAPEFRLCLGFVLQTDGYLTHFKFAL